MVAIWIYVGGYVVGKSLKEFIDLKRLQPTTVYFELLVIYTWLNTLYQFSAKEPPSILFKEIFYLTLSVVLFFSPLLSSTSNVGKKNFCFWVMVIVQLSQTHLGYVLHKTSQVFFIPFLDFPFPTFLGRFLAIVVTQ